MDYRKLEKLIIKRNSYVDKRDELSSKDFTDNLLDPLQLYEGDEQLFIVKMQIIFAQAIETIESEIAEITERKTP